MEIKNWDLCTVIIIFAVIFGATMLLKIGTINKKYKIFILISYILVSLVAGLQTSNSDVNTYEHLYNYEYSQGYNLLQLEYIFRTINKFVYDFIGEFQYVYIIISFITNLFAYKNVLYYSNKCAVKPHYVLFIYLCLYYLVSFGMIRQIAAANIVIYSYRYLLENRKKEFFLCTIFALGFHTTAMLNFAIYFFVGNDIKSKSIKNFLRILIVIFVYIFFINYNRFNEFFSLITGRDYGQSYYKPEELGLGVLAARIPILFFLYINRKTLVKASKEIKLATLMILFEICISFVYYWMPMLGGRIQYYVMFGYALIIPYCILKVRIYGRGIYIWKSTIYLAGIAYVIHQLLNTSWITEFLMPIKFYSFF